MSDVSSKPLKTAPLFVAALTVTGYLVSSLIGALLTSLGYTLAMGTTDGSADWLTSSTTAQFIYTVLTYGLFLSFIIVTFRLVKVQWRDIKLGRVQWKDPLYALAALPVYYGLYLVVIGLVSKLVPSFNADQQQQIGFDNAQGGALILVFVSLVVIPPIVEEIITRGYVYTGLRRTLPIWASALATSAIFAVGHLEFGNGGPLVWVAALFTFVLSLVLVFLRQKTGRLWAGIFLHALVNGISFVALFLHT